MTMLAALREQYCPPAQLQVQRIDKPEPDSGQVLVRVRSCTVNRTDCAVLTGKPAIANICCTAMVCIFHLSLGRGCKILCLRSEQRSPADVK